MKVVDRDGQTWRVTRRWTPWRWRLRKVDPLAGLDLVNGAGDLLSGVVLGLVLLIVAPVLLVAVLAGLEFLLLLLLVPLVVVVRVAFGKQWKVEARRGWTPWWEETAGGWRDSHQRIEDVADAIARGDLPKRTLVPRD